MITVMEKHVTAQKALLVNLVEKIIGEDPFTTKDGLVWAARPQSFYCDELGVSRKTIQRLTNTEPFVKKPMRKAGGGQLSLLRVGTKVQDADDWRRILTKVWRDWQSDPPDWACTKENNKGKPDGVTMKEGSCFWGLAQDLPGELALALFKYAISSKERWAHVAAGAKFASEGLSKWKPMYWDFPYIPMLRRFYRAALNAYVSDIQAGKAKPPDSWAKLNNPIVSAMILKLTDPLDPAEGEIEDERRAALLAYLQSVQVPALAAVQAVA